MATPAEKKALIFLGALIMLGGVVRLWRSELRTERSKPATIATAPSTKSAAKNKGKSSAVTRPTSTPSAKSVAAGSKSAAPPKRTPKPNPDNLENPIDLDIVSLDDLNASGIMKSGIARMVIANRDSFGPFGSILELSRIPYLRKTTITSIAPYVTFSAVPRPSHTVVQARPSSNPPAKPGRQKRTSP